MLWGVHGLPSLRIAQAWPQVISLTISQSTLLGTGASSKSNQGAQQGSTCCNLRGTVSSRQPRIWKKTLTLNKHIYTHKSILINQQPRSYLLGLASTGKSWAVAQEQGYPCQSVHAKTTIHAANQVTRPKR